MPQFQGQRGRKCGQAFKCRAVSLHKHDSLYSNFDNGAWVKIMKQIDTRYLFNQMRLGEREGAINCKHLGTNHQVGR